MTTIIDNIKIDFSSKRKRTIHIYDDVVMEDGKAIVVTKIEITEGESEGSGKLDNLKRKLTNKINSLSPPDQKIAYYLLRKQNNGYA
jgi:hypothetical protein